MRGKLFAAIGFAAVVTSAASAAIFSEDFEALANGELNGQGGWVSADGQPISTSGFLPTRVMRGVLPGGDPSIHYASHAISLVGQTGQISLSYDAFGLAAVDADGEYSHNSGAGLGYSSSSIAAGWIADFGVRWIFDASGLTGNAADTEIVWLGFGKLAAFEILIDRTANTVFGRYAFTDGASGETAHFAIGDPSNIDLLTSITTQQDLTDPLVRTGVDLDNFNLDASPTSVPEPLTTAMGLGAAIVGVRRIRTRRNRVSRT